VCVCGFIFFLGGFWGFLFGVWLVFWFLGLLVSFFFGGFLVFLFVFGFCLFCWVGFGVLFWVVFRRLARDRFLLRGPNLAFDFPLQKLRRSGSHDKEPGVDGEDHSKPRLFPRSSPRVLPLKRSVQPARPYFPERYLRIFGRFNLRAFRPFFTLFRDGLSPFRPAFFSFLSCLF